MCQKNAVYIDSTAAFSGKIYRYFKQYNYRKNNHTCFIESKAIKRCLFPLKVEHFIHWTKLIKVKVKWTFHMNSIFDLKNMHSYVKLHMKSSVACLENVEYDLKDLKI